ncbi:MAG: DNA mismatch repair protein MutS [Leptospiraceae bacterium]|nr:DNA mismatch repair protein MutS [Leptospiraceae bacterium]
MSKDTEAMNTPAMRQYSEFKSQYPNSILFFRMGDFYEMFNEDAIIASKVLDIALTKRQNQIPMCGIPYHARDNYLSRLINSGHTVVICEQIKNDDPNTKLLSREVVRVISPGTIVEENLVKGFENNYLCLFFAENDRIHLIFADASTSELIPYSFYKNEKEKIQTQLKKFPPKEFLLFKEQALKWANLEILEFFPITILDSNLISIPKEGTLGEIKEVLKTFLERNFKEKNFILNENLEFSDGKFLEMDSNTVESLDLVENQSSGTKEKTLFSVLNFCVTAGGKRLLQKKILFPLLSEAKILNVQEKIELLSNNVKTRMNITEILAETSDLERLLSRFRAKRALPRDFKTVLDCIELAKKLQILLKDLSYLFDLSISELDILKEYLEFRLSTETLPPILGGDGQFLKNGFSEELDKAREAKSKGKDWIIELEEKEKIRSGFGTLKIKYNKVVGFYIELSRKEAANAPKHFLKKQTLVTTERFTLKELEDIERLILSADDTIQRIELLEFEKMREEVLSHFQVLTKLATNFSELDYHISLARCKDEYNWILPKIGKNNELILTDSRHPVVEKYLKLGDVFVKNSIQLDGNTNSIAILTGPNMAGKSTFMRQIALNQILFQMGSYVAAKEARFSIVDKLFTRIGAGDNLTAGESTFFVEMKEASYILNNRTEQSLILFDELGRGTSTYDGLSLAWGIIEYLSSLTIDSKRTKTIFATHYHELTELEKENGVFNLFMDTLEKEGEVTFLRKVKQGKAKKSFGIYVAKLAGIPKEIIDRAGEILSSLENNKKEIIAKRKKEETLFSIIEPSSPNLKKITDLLDRIDPNEISPKRAHELIYELKSFTAKQ